MLLIGAGLAKLLGLNAQPEAREKPPYIVPNVKSTAWLTYYQVLEFVQLSLPWIVAGTVLVSILSGIGVLETAAEAARPALMVLFGLPKETFIPLIFGVVRGELTIVMLASVRKTTDFSLFLTPKQMLVFAIISIIYVPCLSTIAALVKEFGKRDTAAILVANLLLTVLIGILANAALSLFLS